MVEVYGIKYFTIFCCPFLLMTHLTLRIFFQLPISLLQQDWYQLPFSSSRGKDPLSQHLATLSNTFSNCPFNFKQSCCHMTPCTIATPRHSSCANCYHFAISLHYNPKFIIFLRVPGQCSLGGFYLELNSQSLVCFKAFLVMPRLIHEI